jgi:hypothetical protein
MNKVLAVIIFSVLFAGCIAHVTPHGTYLEPLPMTVVAGPPVVVEPPHHYALSPLPPVYVEPQRRIYRHNNLYYYYWDNSWYYGERERGPWHRLPREYYPKNYRERDRGGDERQRDNEIRPRPRY